MNARPQVPKESPGRAGLGGTFQHGSAGWSPGHNSKGGNAPLISCKGLPQPRHRCQALLSAATRPSPSPSPTLHRHLLFQAEPWPGEACGPKRDRCLWGGSGAMPGREEAPRELLGTTGHPGPGRTKRHAPAPAPAPGPGPRSRPGQWWRIPRHQGDRSSRAAKPPNQRVSSCPGSSWPRPSCLLAPDWLTAFPLGWDWRLAGGTPPRTGGGCRERAAGARAGRLPSGHAGIVIGGANPPRGLCRCPP